MPFKLLRLAEDQGIIIEYFKFQSRMEAVYMIEPGYPPVICISRELPKNRAHFRSVLAHELGHHFTLHQGDAPSTFLHYSERVRSSYEEHLAMAWAAKYLMPKDKLEQALRDEVYTVKDLARRFVVDEKLVEIRLMIFFEGDMGPEVSKLKYKINKE